MADQPVHFIFTGPDNLHSVALDQTVAHNRASNLSAVVRYGIPPSSWDYPRGTVWQCGDCGRTWVSLGSPARNMPGFCDFKPESWFARWRRARRERRAT